jgi:hypothetical protein
MLVVVLLTAAVGGAFWWLQLGRDRSGGTQHFAGHGLEMDVPGSWNVHSGFMPSTGTGSTFAVVGTQPWGLCLPFDLNCYYERRLEPGQISVDLSLGFLNEGICETGATRSDLAGRGPDDPVATGSLARVGGRPALQVDYAVGEKDYYRSDEWRSWTIAAPGTTLSAYVISARYRAPGVDAFRAELDRMMATVRFVNPAQLGAGGPPDCGPPFPP